MGFMGIAHVDGEQFPAAVHIGSNPTFGESGRKLEVHLLDFEGDLYGRMIDVDLIDRVRGTERFSGADASRRSFCLMSRRFAKSQRFESDSPSPSRLIHFDSGPKIRFNRAEQEQAFPSVSETG
jgi:hypothetical protein